MAASPPLARPRSWLDHSTLTKHMKKVLTLGLLVLAGLVLAGCVGMPNLSLRLAGSSGPGVTLTLDLAPGDTVTNQTPPVALQSR